MSASSWTWDPNRQAYYYWSAQEGCFVYQDGRRVYPNQAEQRGVAASQTSPEYAQLSLLFLHMLIQLGNRSPRTAPATPTDISTAANEHAGSPSSGDSYHLTSGSSSSSSVDPLTTQLQHASLNEALYAGKEPVHAPASLEMGFAAPLMTRP